MIRPRTTVLKRINPMAEVQRKAMYKPAGWFRPTWLDEIVRSYMDYGKWEYWAGRRLLPMDFRLPAYKPHAS